MPEFRGGLDILYVKLLLKYTTKTAIIIMSVKTIPWRMGVLNCRCTEIGPCEPIPGELNQWFPL